MICLVIVTTLSLIVGCTGGQITDEVEKEETQNEFISETGFYLDTIIEIKIYNPDDNSEEIIDKAIGKITELEQLLSVHIEGSDIWNLQKNAGVQPVKVLDETLEVIQLSIEHSELTNGVFDITIGPLVDLWAIDPPEGYIPTEEELETILPKVDYEKLIINEGNKTVFLEDEGMIANLGAIAKGYIADEVKEVLIENGVENAIINLGGNVLLVGGRPDNTSFKIGIQDPNSERGRYLGVVSAEDISIVSSGDYERYFEVEGNRYHHILNPITGYPADNELRQVNILSENSALGDGLSTSVFLMGLEDGMALVESMDNIEAIFLTKDNKIYLSSGIGENFIFNEDNYGDKYTIVVNYTG